MKVIGEEIRISTGVRDENGDRLEPEEQRVRKTIRTAVPVNGSRDGVIEPIAGALGGALHTDMPAHVAADELTRRCDLCAHWANQDWISKKRELEGTEEGRRLLLKFRAALLGEGRMATEGLAHGDETQDAEHALSRGGVCKALSAIFAAQAPVITLYDTAPCMAVGKGPAGEDCYDLFTPKRGAKSTVVAARDGILQRANGRIR